MSEEPNVELTSEDDLRALLAPHRPDPRAFETKVKARIAERVARGDTERAEPSRLVRWAASVLPPDVGCALLAKKAGLATTLVLPALILASSFGAFVASKRSIERSSRDAEPPTAPEPKWNARPPTLNRDLVRSGRWLTLLRYGSLLTMIAPALVGGAHAIDITVGLLLGAMGVLALSVRGLASAGLMRRGTLASMCCGLLTTVFVACFIWTRGMNAADPTSRLGASLRSSLMLVGIAGCALVMLRERSANKGRIAFLIGWCVVVFALFVPAWTPARPAQLASYLSSFEADTGELRGWDEADYAGEALLAIGEPLPNLEHMRRAVEHAIEAGDECHPTVWTTAARLDLVDAAHWKTLAERKMEAYALDQLLSGIGPLRKPRYNEYELWMLLATRPTTPEQRAKLAERVEANWPREPAYGMLRHAQQCVRWWALLDRQDRIDAHRADLHELLERHWVSGKRLSLFATIGGFTSDPTKFYTSFDDDTWIGVDLLARVGIPPGIDPWLLRGHVRGEADRGLVPWAPTDLSIDSVATLLRLEREIGVPRRDALETLLGERALIATCLTLLLCIVAIRAGTSRAELEAAGLDVDTPR
ncbi:MAG: hypothetical protein HZA52_03360 [Planctomycetes bacterium]|nr:hypothetical protein [Planctomycetota bacterium]